MRRLRDYIAALAYGVKVREEDLAEDLLRTSKVTLSSALIKTLRATPQVLVPAPGVGKYIELVSVRLRLIAGTNVLTESTANLAVKLTNGSGAAVSQTVETTGFIDQAANTLTNGLPKIDAIATQAASVNAPLVLHNLGAAEYGGNAANDAQLEVLTTYRVRTL